MAALEELRRQTLLPINQAAAMKLRQAGIQESGAVQAVFQLMEWGIARDKRRRYQDIAHELDLLAHAPDQAAALEYLVAKVPGGVRETVRTVLRLGPIPAARKLLELLDMRLKSDPKKGEAPDDFLICGGEGA